MSFKKNGVIGIIGGCGPYAGVSVMKKVLDQTAAKKDQEHLPLLLSSIPESISDRTAFILGHTEQNPGLEIAELIMQLESIGACIIGVACNTFHVPVIFDKTIEILRKHKSHVKIVHMVNETVNYLKTQFPFIRKVGIFATNGAYQTGLYDQILLQNSYEVVRPPFRMQEYYIHDCVYNEVFGIKASSDSIADEVRTRIDRMISFYREEGVQAIILGCTEFSLAFQQDSVDGIKIIDSSKVLAASLITEYYKTHSKIKITTG